jgi:hypothetical protein
MTGHRNSHFNHAELLDCLYNIKHTYEIGVANAGELVQVYLNVMKREVQRHMNLMFGTSSTERRILILGWIF